VVAPVQTRRTPRKVWPLQLTMERVLSPLAYYKGSHILLAVVQSVDLSSLRIHQEGDVVAQTDDPVEPWNEVEHFPVAGRSACNKIQGAPWEAG
jgi:hypothetical protein